MNPAPDVDSLIAALQRIAEEAPEVPLVKEARFDREEIYDLLDQLRAILPEEAKQARWISKEREDLVREARKEAADIVSEARRRAQEMLSPQVIAREAERSAQEIVEEAQYEERRLRLSAEDYADDILETMQANLQRFIDASRRGRRALRPDEDEGAEPEDIG